MMAEVAKITGVSAGVAYGYGLGECAFLNPAAPLSCKYCCAPAMQFGQGITFSWPKNGCASNPVAAQYSALPGGNRNNNGTFNNIGNNGNWWSATEYDATNAWKRNLNYNNSQVNRNNNNKRYGFSVRCVRDLNEDLFTGQGGESHLPFSSGQLELLSKPCRDTLLTDLFQAYYDAHKNKRNTINALKFEKHLESNLFVLYNEIIENRYEPKPSICFIVNKPVKREIFAADFRDRVVHHLIFNYISPVFEKSFINDCYSCRKGKGTHYGIRRVEKFIRSCSQNYRNNCYILKLDIKGYFMSINKNLLYEKLVNYLSQQQHKLPVNLSMIQYLISKTIFTDPKNDCIIKGNQSDWKGLPKTKSLFHAKENCGLPIGNLTSQLFANIYLNDFDHYIKEVCKIKYYGRYVDDFVLVHPDKDYLKSLIPHFSGFLQSNLQLTLHPDKIYLQHYSNGIKFLGVVIKPYRTYIAKRTKGNFYQAIEKQNKIIRAHKPDAKEMKNFQSIMNSYLGIMKHYKTYKIRKQIIKNYLSAWWWNLVCIKGGYQKFILK